MSIRRKLLLLLLSIALVPLLFSTVLDRLGAARLGRQLGAATRERQIQQATSELRQQIEDQAALVQSRRALLEQALRVQARAVEKCLAEPVPDATEPDADRPRILEAADYDRPNESAIALVPSVIHARAEADGALTPIPVSFDHVVFKLAPGTRREEVRDDMARLVRLTDEYRFLRRLQSQSLYWQYTALENGVHSAYPGHGGYPEDYDARERDWYVAAREADRLVWIPPYIDAASKQLIITVSMPVRRADGRFAGVTGLDLTVGEVVRMASPPATHAGRAMSLVVAFPRTGQGAAARPIVIARPGYSERATTQQAGFEAELLESDDADAMKQLLEAMLARQSGSLQMPYLGRDALWVYGLLAADGPTYLIVIVPYDELIAPALATEREFQRRTTEQLRTAGLVSLGVLVVVVIVALAGARAVTRPVQALARAAERVARGDFEARVDARGKDELARLGQAFNAMVPQLSDRVRIRQALQLANEIQQNLLPDVTPHIPGFDVAAVSVYCDQMGGDYYDFLDLSHTGRPRYSIAVGDVTSHGVAAAILMATGRALIRGHATEAVSAAELVTRVNRALSGDVIRGRFMTLFYLELMASERSATWVSAGHDPALLFDPQSGQFRDLEGEDLPLGVDEAWQFHECGPLLLRQGQVLVLGTDGIWEQSGEDGRPFGKQTLRDVVQRHASKAARDIAQAILAAHEAFRGSVPQSDDIAIVVVKVGEGGVERAAGSGR